MKEKEKGKHNPFIKELRPGEEILWLHSGPIKLSRDYDNRAELPILVFMLILSFVSLVLVSTKEFVELGLLMFGTICITPFLFSWLWIAFLRRPLGAYAVTNERLLTYDSNKIIALELEDLDVHYESDGSLSFNILYPRWTNVPDAQAVLNLIKKAAESRTNELQERQLNERKREGQA